MTSLIKHRAAPWAIPLMALLLSGPFATTAVAVPPCFDIRVDYLGRVPVGNVNGVQYYRWTYRVTGANCINRRMQHFTMSLCTSTQQSLSQISLQCTDNADPVGGLTSNYQPAVGLDGTTGLNGVRWNFLSGNPIDQIGEWDEFSFVASGLPAPVSWAGRSGPITIQGSTIGPACAPVPVESSSWSSIKSLLRP